MPFTQRNAKMSELISVTPYPLKPRIQAEKSTVYKTLFPEKNIYFDYPLDQLLYELDIKQLVFAV